MPVSLPRIVAHRGASHAAPENTLAAVKAAYHENACWVEVDVKLSGDGVPVLMHDDTVDRTTDRCGKVSAYAMHDLAACDAGGWFDARFKGEPVPSLATLLDMAAPLGLGVNLEIKPNPGESEKTAQATACLLAQYYDNAASAPILLSSFDRVSLKTLHRSAPDWARGLLVSALPEDWQGFAGQTECISIHTNVHRLKRCEAEAIKQAGFELLVYTVNHVQTALSLRDWGVDAVITDYPGKLIQKLGQ